MQTLTRYSALEYRNALIVVGTLDVFNGAVPIKKVRDADLVVCVKGNTYRVVKDRFGVQGDIEAMQFVDIRDNLPNVEIVHGR